MKDTTAERVVLFLVEAAAFIVGSLLLRAAIYGSW